MRWWARAGTVCVAFFKNIVWLSFLLHYSKGVPLASFHFHYPASKESLSVPHSLYFLFFFLRSIYWKVMPFRISETSTLRLLISLTANNSLSIRSFYSFFFPYRNDGLSQFPSSVFEIFNVFSFFFYGFLPPLANNIPLTDISHLPTHSPTDEHLGCLRFWLLWTDLRIPVHSNWDIYLWSILIYTVTKL